MIEKRKERERDGKKPQTNRSMYEEDGSRFQIRHKHALEVKWSEARRRRFREVHGLLLLPHSYHDCCCCCCLWSIIEMHYFSFCLLLLLWRFLQVWYLIFSGFEYTTCVACVLIERQQQTANSCEQLVLMIYRQWLEKITEWMTDWLKLEVFD